MKENDIQSLFLPAAMCFPLSMRTDTAVSALWIPGLEGANSQSDNYKAAIG